MIVAVMDQQNPKVPPPLPAAPVPATTKLDSQRTRPAPMMQAARASWLGAAIALVLMLLTWKMPHGTGSIVIAIINGALLVAGLILGTIALARTKRTEFAAIFNHAIVGVTLCLLIIIVMIWPFFS